MKKIFIFIIVGLFSFLRIFVAYADFKVCNTTQDILGVALGYRAAEDWISEGWWHIAPLHCTVIKAGPLLSRFYYLRVEDNKNNGYWKGSVPFCVKDKKFKIEGVGNCFVRGFQKALFQEIDTGNQKDWIVQLVNAAH